MKHSEQDEVNGSKAFGENGISGTPVMAEGRTEGNERKRMAWMSKRDRPIENS